jgi:hypothetical protein
MFLRYWIWFWLFLDKGNQIQVHIISPREKPDVEIGPSFCDAGYGPQKRFPLVEHSDSNDNKEGTQTSVSCLTCGKDNSQQSPLSKQLILERPCKNNISDLITYLRFTLWQCIHMLMCPSRPMCFLWQWWTYRPIHDSKWNHILAIYNVWRISQSIVIIG